MARFSINRFVPSIAGGAFGQLIPPPSRLWHADSGARPAAPLTRYRE
ncbi:MAG TPA: hypothetical protein VEB66_11090 [Opitutaceae bacterium]|nr:hypothetical protein [Opitutaceae bacterium]